MKSWTYEQLVEQLVWNKEHHYLVALALLNIEDAFQQTPFITNYFTNFVSHFVGLLYVFEMIKKQSSVSVDWTGKIVRRTPHFWENRRIKKRVTQASIHANRTFDKLYRNAYCKVGFSKSPTLNLPPSFPDFPTSSRYIRHCFNSQAVHRITFYLTGYFSAWWELQFKEELSQNRTNFCNKTHDHFSAKNKLSILKPNFTKSERNWRSV